MLTSPLPPAQTPPAKPSAHATGITRADFELKPFTTPSNWIASWQILNTLVPFGLLWWVAVWSLHQAPLLLLPVIALMVLFLARCFSLMHDCGHNALFRSRRVNRAVGFLFGIVCGIPQLPWSRGHAFHHRHNGNWERYQGPSALITTQAYSALSPVQQRWYGRIRHPLMLFPGGFFYLVIKPRVAMLLGLVDLARQGSTRHWHSPEEFRDLALNNLAVVCLWIGMGWWIGAGPFWLIYSPVMACAAAIFICIFFVQHNFPGSYAHVTEGWSEMAGSLEGTSDLELPALFNWFSADIGCHAIHHLSSAIPNYRLRACQQRNQHLLSGVKRLRLGDIPTCFDYILWDPAAERLATLPAPAQ
ncbi:fatty acid desaturase [Synechococcus sp. CS-1328]|uniref:fatty acid desaturase n=1 Tax=Synechococcus sp. CS-1328 TaxID=2847976 RepID=UPI00223B3233|nr:fatty acid desaturase [Synechococcus sp. CS-1328]